MSYIFLKLPEVKKRTGKGKTAIYKEIKEGTFPKQIYNGKSSVAWLENEIEEWQKEKISNRKFMTHS